MWILVGVMIVVLAVIFAVWFGIKASLVAPMNRLIDSIRHIAGGDLVKPIEVDGSNEMGQLAESLRHMQGELMRTVGDVRNGANAIYSGASEIATGNNDLSSRTEQQAASLEETAASMEQLTATVKQNAENARQASHLALSASETAQRGGKVVDNVVQTMRDISTSSQKIADIISVIDGIAFQTNILALNAAVEAARAGEQGRGFAVVAGEVRNLAQRSAQAAREIKSLIEDSVGKVDVGSTLVESAGETMAEIVSAVTRVTDIMGEIAYLDLPEDATEEETNAAIEAAKQGAKVTILETDEDWYRISYTLDGKENKGYVKAVYVEIPKAELSNLPEDGEENSAYNSFLEKVLEEPGVQIRIFGKPEIQGHRRVGVILATADSVEEALAKAERAYAKLEVKVY